MPLNDSPLAYITRGTHIRISFLAYEKTIGANPRHTLAYSGLPLEAVSPPRLIRRDMQPMVSIIIGQSQCVVHFGAFLITLVRTTIISHAVCVSTLPYEYL